MKPRRLVLWFLVASVAVLLLLDTLLWRLDPIGIVRYFADFEALSRVSVPFEDGARYLPGVYHFSNYSLTIGLDGLRIVPESKYTDCTIAFVGDSVTFGMGANDYETFSNVLAYDLDENVINAGMPAYSAGNIQKLIKSLPADGYIWLIIQNDDDLPMVWQGGAGGGIPSATNLYLGWLFPGDPDLPTEMDKTRFVEMATPVLARDDVLAFAFEGAMLSDVIVQAFPKVILIPQYTGNASQFDPHPNGVGHRQIADAMRAAVLTFTAARCDGR